jgi:hypothetical protein
LDAVKCYIGQSVEHQRSTPKPFYTHVDSKCVPNDTDSRYTAEPLHFTSLCILSCFILSNLGSDSIVLVYCIKFT